MPWQDIKLLGFCPDLPVTTPGYFTTTDYCAPTDRGIGNAPGLRTLGSGKISSASMGGALLSKTDNTQELIIGTATKLYGFDTVTNTLTDRSGATYNASTTNTWSVTQFGNIALAANLGDQLQQRTIGAGANFASVGAAPVPKASIVVTCGPVSAPFVMVFDYNDGTNVDRDGWKCSAVSDYTGWTSGTNSCATGRLLDNVPGPVTSAIPYRDGVIAWKRTGMYVGEYTGPPNIWSWRRISADVGCVGKNACAIADDVVYFASDVGVWMFDGSYPKRVPGYVHKWWTEQSETPLATPENRNYFRVTSDKQKHLIWFLIANTSSGNYQSGLAYNTVSGLWTCVNSSPFVDGDSGGGSTIGYELLSANYATCITSVPDRPIGGVSFGAGHVSHINLATIKGWCISDRVNSTIIKGVRPHWSIAPEAPSVSDWTYGVLYAVNAERDLQPGAFATPLANSDLVFRQPGKLDGVLGGEIMSFSVSMSGGFTWEMTGISLDINKAGRS